MTGVQELIAALVALAGEWSCEEVSASYRLPDGHLLTLHVNAGQLTTIERDDGWLVSIPPEPR